MSNARKAWISGAILIAILVSLAAWFLLLFPVREDAALSKEEALGIEDSNMILESKVSALRKQFAEIDTYRAELTALEGKIPSDVDYTTLVNEISRSAEESEVALISIEADGRVEPVAPFTAIKETPKPAPVADGEEAPVPTPTPTEIVTVSGQPPTLTGALSKVIDGFYQMPIVMKVQGDYDEVLKFSDEIQRGSNRAILVHSIEVAALREAAESESAPEAEIGDMLYSLNAIVYVLQSQVVEFDKAQAGADGEPAKVELPKAADKNLFAPER